MVANMTLTVNHQAIKQLLSDYFCPTTYLT